MNLVHDLIQRYLPTQMIGVPSLAITVSEASWRIIQSTQLVDKPPPPTYYFPIMASERLKRQIDRLLDEAEQAFVSRDWDTVRRCAQDVLAFDPDNPDASGLLAGAERALGTETAITGAPQGTPVPLASPSQPTSFANGRSQVKRFLNDVRILIP
jgi:hypothetical protein